jgi:hypothetical protein
MLRPIGVSDKVVTGRNKTSVQVDRAFTLVIGDLPVVSFAARNQMEARELAREEWMRADLALYRSNNNPLWDGQAKLSVRLSRPDEAARLSQAAGETSDADGIVLAFLVEIDSAERG